MACQEFVVFTDNSKCARLQTRNVGMHYDIFVRV